MAVCTCLDSGNLNAHAKAQNIRTRYTDGINFVS